MLEEMLDLLQAQIVEVFRLLPVALDGPHLVDRHCQPLVVAAGFVAHLQHPTRAAA